MATVYRANARENSFPGHWRKSIYKGQLNTALKKKKCGTHVAHVAAAKGWFYKLINEAVTDGGSAPAVCLKAGRLARSWAHNRHARCKGDQV